MKSYYFIILCYIYGMLFCSVVWTYNMEARCKKAELKVPIIDYMIAVTVCLFFWWVILIVLIVWILSMLIKICNLGIVFITIKKQKE